MTSLPRVVLASCSVAIIGLVGATGVALGPDDLQVWLLVSAVLAVITAVQATGSDPTDLMPALLLSLPPVISLIAEGSPTWLIGPLGAMLLAAAELNALSWDCRGPDPMSDVMRRRMRHIAQLASLALAASLAVSLAPGPSAGGRVAVVVAATALAALGGVVFRRSA